MSGPTLYINELDHQRFMYRYHGMRRERPCPIQCLAKQWQLSRGLDRCGRRAGLYGPAKRRRLSDGFDSNAPMRVVPVKVYVRQSSERSAERLAKLPRPGA